MLTDNVNDIWLEVGGWGMGAEEGRYEHNSALVLLSPLGTVVWTLVVRGRGKGAGRRGAEKTEV